MSAPRRVFGGPAEIADAAAARVTEAAGHAIEARGEFRLALSGGSTPVALYRVLAAPPWRERVAWERVVFLFADERAVPRGDPERNHRLADETLLRPLGIAEPHVRHMRAESGDLERAAAEYERELERPIDLAILGVGADGHTASIFPGSAAAREEVRRCVAVTESPKPPARRLTLTPRALREMRAALVLAVGTDKAAAVAAAFDPGSTPETCPASLLRSREWLIDRAAASRLDATSAS